MAEIAIIVAMTPTGVIGKNNRIPWHLPADLQHFKKITMGYPIVMGRKTFESLPGILPGRRHIVLTRNCDYGTMGCDVATDWQQVERTTENDAKVFIIGGADIYKYILPMVQRMYLTIVYADIKGGICFPAWDKNEWSELKRDFRPKDEKNVFDMEFIEYLRLTP